MGAAVFIFFAGAFFGATLDLVLLLAITVNERKSKEGDDDEKPL